MATITDHEAVTTVGARIACLSSFYRFLVRMGIASGNHRRALRHDPDIVLHRGPA